MVRRHFLLSENENTGNIYGEYDWCIKYSAKQRVKLFGMDFDTYVSELSKENITVIGDNFVWLTTGEPVNLTHDVWDESTKEGCFGFVGTEPLACMGGIWCKTSDSEDELLYHLLFGGKVDDYNITKIESPDNTHVIYFTFLASSCGYLHCLEDYTFPKNFPFEKLTYSIIPDDAPFLQKPLIFKKEWTTDVKNQDALDFPHSMAKVAKIIVEEGHPTYDSRNDCGCIIETATNTLLVGSSQGFIPDSVTSLAISCFYGSLIEELYIPDTVVSSSPYIVAKCSKLKTLNTPFLHLGYVYNFSECTSLSNIIYRGYMQDVIDKLDMVKLCYSPTPATVIHCIDGDVTIK